MKRLVLVILVASIGGARLEGSSVIDCSGNAAAVNSCIAGKLPSFNTRLDWAALGPTAGYPLDGVARNSVWTLANAGPSGVDIRVSGESNVSNLEGIKLAYNMGSMWYGGEWTLVDYVSPHPYYFAGHFDAPPNTSGAVPPGSPGDDLLGLALNGTSSSAALVLEFSSGFSDIGFRISSVHDSDFTTTIQVLDAAGHPIQLGTEGGSPVYARSFAYAGVGGTCESLYHTNNPAPNAIDKVPVPCNDAPFISALAFNNQARSIVISTSDPRGFYIGDLYFFDTPEPGTVALLGGGMLLLAVCRRRTRSRA